jgi:hypothetical protein
VRGADVLRARVTRDVERLVVVVEPDGHQVSRCCCCGARATATWAGRRTRSPRA